MRHHHWRICHHRPGRLAEPIGAREHSRHCRGEATIDATQLYLAASVFGDGRADVGASQRGFLDILETGDLTVSVRYSQTWSGIPDDRPAFITNGGLWLTLGNLFYGRQTVNTFEDNGRIDAGILSTTHRVNRGDRLDFSLGATKEASVPEPDTLSLAAIGMIGLAGFVAWRRRERLS